MDLKTWRVGRGWTVKQMGEALGFPVGSTGSQAERIENGKIKADADLIADIKRITDGSVAEADMQATRLAYLERTGKRRSFEPSETPEAAE
jgi:transcriptional regulator with XRE-family HTH domain